MLNELSSLVEGLERRGIDIVQRSDALNQATKLPGFIFQMDATDGVCGVEFVATESMPNRWKVAETKFKSFPILNLNKPFYVIDQYSLPVFGARCVDALNKDKWMDFFKSGLDESKITLNVEPKHIKRLTDSGYSYPKELLEKITGESEFFQLANCLIAWFGKLSRKDLHKRGVLLAEQMTTLIENSYLDGRIQDSSSVCSALFGSWNKREKVFESPKVQIGFALKGKLDTTLAGSFDEVNQALLSLTGSRSKGVCSLSGETVPLVEDSFPGVTLKGFGQARLFSSYGKMRPAQLRYSKFGAATFPTSESKAKKYANALQTICADEFQGKIWQTIPSSAPKKKDLLIAWLSGEKIESNPLQDKMANLWCPMESIQSITLYEAKVQKLVGAFQNPKAISPDAEQRIIVLKKVYKESMEVVANLSYRLEEVSAGITSWEELAKQSIYFRLPIKFKGEDKLTLLSPYVPSPRSMMKLFRKLYLRSGKVKALHGVPVKRVFDLFLTPPSNNRFDLDYELLRRLLKSVQELLINIRAAQIISFSFWLQKKKQAQRKATEILKPFTTSARHDALVAISFLTILMERLQRDNRRYLMSAVFQLGKLLAKVDELHLAYSRKVRKDDIPNQLIGNSMVRIAMQNPVQALERLGEKLPLYQNWAKVHNAQASDGFVEMLLSQIGRASREIDLDELGSPVTPKTKAALLLGYLAWEKKNEGGAK